VLSVARSPRPRRNLGATCAVGSLDATDCSAVTPSAVRGSRAGSPVPGPPQLVRPCRGAPSSTRQGVTGDPTDGAARPVIISDGVRGVGAARQDRQKTLALVLEQFTLFRPMDSKELNESLLTQWVALDRASPTAVFEQGS
jgi:hypothetical protein